jgi:hypothetical protein
MNNFFLQNYINVQVSDDYAQCLLMAIDISECQILFTFFNVEVFIQTNQSLSTVKHSSTIEIVKAFDGENETSAACYS